MERELNVGGRPGYERPDSDPELEQGRHSLQYAFDEMYTYPPLRKAEYRLAVRSPLSFGEAFRTSFDGGVPRLIAKFVDVDKAAFGGCGQDILRVAGPACMGDPRRLCLRRMLRVDLLRVRRNSKLPCSADLKRVCSAHDESILYSGENELRARTERDEGRGVLVELGEVHVQVFMQRALVSGGSGWKYGLNDARDCRGDV